MAAATVVLPTPPAPAQTTIRRPFKSGRSEADDTARIYHALAVLVSFAFRPSAAPLVKTWPSLPGTAKIFAMLEPIQDRRRSRSENTLVALTRLLEAARTAAALEAVALGDDAGLLVAGAGAAELCDELAAIAPLGGAAATDTLPTGWDVLGRPIEVHRVAVAGLDLFVSGRGGNLGLGLGRIAAGCTRILAKEPGLAR
jgi:hypothetical protein